VTVTALEASTSTRYRVARWISILGHPFVLVLLLVGSLTLQVLPPGRAFLVTGIVFAASILPMALTLRRHVRTGRCTDYDVSVREERARIYPAALGVVLVTLLVLAWIGPPRDVLAGTVAVLALLGTASLVNLRHKISLHTAFGVYVALCFLPLSAGLAGAGAALAVAIGWSRIAMGRHTPAEVASGLVLGAVVGTALLVWRG
jgi:membrane-associated phospholipid phosphatase